MQFTILHVHIPSQYQTVSRQRLFSPLTKLERGKIRSILTNDGPIIVIPGTDSEEKILAVLPEGYSRRDKFTNQSYFQTWINICESLFGKGNIKDFVHGTQEIQSNEKNYFEPLVDAAIQKETRNLEQRKREMERSREIRDASVYAHGSDG